MGSRSGLPLLLAMLLGILIGAGLATRWFTREAGPPPLAPGAAAVCFTPGEDCTARIVAAIGDARRDILVQAYSFTSPPIAEALVAAHRRRVRVRVIVDDGQLSERFALAARVDAAGVEVLVDDPPGIAHNKVIVVDGALVPTGSFNFSRSAQEGNAENLLLLNDPALAARYAANWDRRRAVSLPYARAVAAEAANDNERQSRRRDRARRAIE